MAPTSLLKKTIEAKETTIKEYLRFTPSGRGVKVVAGRVDEVVSGGQKGDVSDPLLTPTNPPPHFFPFNDPITTTATTAAATAHFPHPNHFPTSMMQENDPNKPLPLEPGAGESMGLGLGLGGMGEMGEMGHMRGLSGDDEVNPEYTPSARAKVLPWVTERHNSSPPPPPPHLPSTRPTSHVPSHTYTPSQGHATRRGSGGSVSHRDGLVSAAVYAREHEAEGHVPGKGTDGWVEDEDEQEEEAERKSKSGSEASRGDRKERKRRDRDRERDHRHPRREREGKKSGGVKSKSKSKAKTRSTNHSKGPTEESGPTTQGGEIQQAGTSMMHTTTQGPNFGQPDPGQTLDPAQQMGLHGGGFGNVPPNSFPQGAAAAGPYGSFAGLPHQGGFGMAPAQGTGVPNQPGAMPWGQANPNQMRTGEQPTFNPAFVNSAGLAQPYHQGEYHQAPQAFPNGMQFQGVPPQQPVVNPVQMPWMGFGPGGPVGQQPVVGLADATASAQREHEQQMAMDRITEMQQQMLRAAEQSRLALAEQQEEQEQEEREKARKEALTALGGTGRTAHAETSPGSVKSKKNKKNMANDQSRFPTEPAYIHTNVGSIKTYETVRKLASRGSDTHDQDEGDFQSEQGSQVDREARSPKRATKQTFVTETTAPSFGHFGRPFSHEINARDFIGHHDVLEEEEIISPVGGGPPIFVMRRVAHGEGHGMGLGLGLNALFGKPAAPRDQRSAYVETVLDEEDLRSPQGRGNATFVPTSAPSTTPPSRETSRRAGSQPDTPKTVDTPKRSKKGSNISLQGSPGIDKPMPPLPTAHEPLSDARPRLRPPLSANPAHRLSTATTTMSLVNQIVTDSRFHDDALCDLLRAAREDSLGIAAKKAVRRAARERVMDLTGMREKYPGRADSEKTVKPPAGRGRSSSDEEEDEPPAWSKALFDMLERTNARLDALDLRMSSSNRTGPSESLPPGDDEEEMAARAALHNLLFPDLPMEIPLFGSGPYATPPRSQFKPGQAHISEIRSETLTHGVLPDWDSSVEIPDGSSIPTAPVVPIAPLGPPITPTIHVQPPTAEPSMTGGARSHLTAATPRANTESRLPDDARSTATARRVVPPPKSKASHSPSSVKSHGDPRTAASTMHPSRETTQTTNYEDPLLPNLPFPRPWDVVTQRLFSWALVWPPEDFVRSLETTALGKQVDEFALTIYMMTIFKRNLRHRMCSVPPLPCDKLFVPPNLADSINRAVHSKRFSDAKQILEELWYPFGFKEPPRVIVALAKHRNDANHWSAHRFDMPTGRLVTFSFSTEEKSLVDGRPFMWWFAIREAWPTWNIPHPDHLAQKTQRVIAPESSKNDNALMAANCGRNLLLGWKPDQSSDLKKMRNNIWNETKRLYERKAKGKLVIDSKDY